MATGVVHDRTGWRVTLEADGVTGRGEAVPLPAFGTESPDACELVLRSFQVLQLPQTLADFDELLAGLEATPAARSAIEAALLEHLARRQGVPVRTLLGGVEPSVAVNALIEGANAGALARAAEHAVAEGFSVVKVKVAARPLSVDAQRLYAVRQAIGPSVGLRVDANGSWSEANARSLLRGLEALKLEVCEQPVSRTDVEALRRLRGAVPCRIAADETLQGGERTERLLECDPRPAVDVLVLKPTALGGVLPALELARRAAERGVDSYVTTLIDGPLARAAATHLASALPRQTYAHGLSTVELFEDVVPDAFTPVRGLIRLPEAAGWGVS